MGFFPVYSRMRNMRITPISVNADGTLATVNRNLTVSKTATGTYLITLDKSLQQNMFIFPQCRYDGVARHIANVSSGDLAEKTAKVKCYTIADSLADAPWDALIIGSDGRGLVHGVIPSQPMVTLARPRFLPFFYDGANAQMYSMHAWGGTMVKTGTGRYSLTFRRQFQQVPYIVCSNSTVLKGVEIRNKTALGCDFEVFNLAGGAAADDSLFIFVLGSDARQVFQRHVHGLVSPEPYTFIDPYEYNGVGGSPSMTRAGAVFTAVDNGTGDYSFTRVKSQSKAGFGLVTSNGALTHTAINNRTNTGFKVAAEADAIIYGLDVGYVRGRDQG